ncbi:DNA polymerase III subunit gamma/tau [Streptobacillus moniliformis]|uniref:DNA polymerase III subunit gamma/tau n=1 Tax=Streptobacillus moniliformis TaxID=34105 RepID=UPI0007E3E72D|nr:DNA polymerase III subunit gamma/tau [Streptobacillus moniliformis]
MENITLYRKYRPQNFSELYGQEHIVRAIKNSLDNDKLSHAYLFNGPRGVGKTTIARLIAKGANCNSGITSNPCDDCENCKEITKGISVDIIEIDAASNRGIDEIRDLKESTGYLPVKCRKKVYIIDEVHMLTKEAFNALLKILEEPPKHIIFILATTEIEKIPDTVISRCQRYDFKTISETDIINMLKKVAKNENINIDTESLELIYSKSEGSARDSFSIFEQVTSNYYNEDEITIDKTEKALGVVSKIFYNNFTNLIIENKKDELISFIDKLWIEGIQIDQFLRDFCKYIKHQDIDLDLKTHIISNVLEILVKYKNEEDKRLLAYIIINKILKMSTSVNVNTVNMTNTEIEFSLEKWQIFIKHLYDLGRQRYYNLIKDTKISVQNNNITIINDRSNYYFRYLNSENTIDFLEKELEKKFGFKYNILIESTSEEKEEFDEEIKNKIISIFNAIEK